MSSMTPQSLRRYTLTASVTAITVTGALYGAGLKTRQEHKQEKSAALEASPAEKLEHLEVSKTKLLRQRAELQSKIDRLAVKTKETPQGPLSQT
ncbi:uncharacterized protein LTR77_000382 [Saxophila tyrrhenica]|uniref:Uncharacterized protein n=1 Tax=Saxophila tyrrhenica TaxID=1690608 RepID=A0AAV9PP20_9PEZI|nr:hypothetical protein LTR77_000382 [Saxophila tyrrhenica]